MTAQVLENVVQLRIDRFRTQITQLAIVDIPCFCCFDNIACFEPHKCNKLNLWLGVPVALQQPQGEAQ